MQTFKEYAPTQFDVKGLGQEDKQNWLVAPCGVNRDSEPIDRCNWDIQEDLLLELDPECKNHETARYGHWACGWLEIALINPESKVLVDMFTRVKMVIEDGMSLDDDRLSYYEDDSGYSSDAIDEFRNSDLWKKWLRINFITG